MYDKQVRRRRAVLGLLVGLSLVLLTAYFGESAGGALHSVQRGVLEVLAPVQEGASRALKPFRDLAGWFGDTVDAKSEREKLKRERDSLRRQLVAAQTAQTENAQLRRLVGVDDQGGLASYDPVTARVIGRSNTIWYSTVNIDKGSSSGVRSGQPVINGEGLVGRVTSVSPHAAQVTLITDHTTSVSAKLVDGRGTPGLVEAVAGKPDELLLDFIERGRRVREKMRVVTAGTNDESRLESRFPPGILIGEVTKVDIDELELYQRVHIRPYADLRTVDFIQVLTRPNGGRGIGQLASRTP